MRVYPEAHALKWCGKKKEAMKKRAAARDAGAARVAGDVDTEMKSGHAMLFSAERTFLFATVSFN
jgi:hypothetical protein